MADTTTMQIRPASDADLVAALALDRQLFGDDAWPESEVKEWWKAGAVSMIVAANKDALLGFADAFTINMQAYLRLIHGTITSDQLTIADADPGGDHWWIGVVAVSPKYQQQNIGQTLWLAIDDALGGKVCADIWSAGGNSLVTGSPNWQLTLPGNRPIWTRTTSRAPRATT